MPETSKKIQKGNNIIYSVLLIIGFATVIGGVYFYNYQANNIIQDVHNDLKIINNYKAEQISEWRRERMADAKHFANSPLYTNALENWLITHDPSIESQIAKRNQMIKELRGYEFVFIINNVKTKEVSFNLLSKLDTQVEPLIDSAFKNKKIYVSEPYFSAIHRHNRIAMVSPIIGSKNQSIAVLVFYTNPADFLIPALQGEPLTYNSLETTLIRLSTDSIYILNSKLLPRVQTIAKKLAIQKKSLLTHAINGTRGIIENWDHESIICISDVANSPWIIMSEIKRNEVFSDLQFKAIVLMIIIIVLTILIGFGFEMISRKRIVQELIEARDKAQRSDKLKDAFLQNLSHEIRTPLNAIVGFAGLLNDTSLNSNQQKEFKSIILNSSNQLLSIVSDVLTAARIQTGQESIINKPFFINETIDKLKIIFEPQIQPRNIDFKIHKGIENPLFKIISDESKITQILSCMLNNAVKFTSSGFVELGYTVQGKEIEFYVKDSGIGIADEAQELIFERFRQADANISATYGGTGLGLAISKAFANMLGGSIRLISAPGKGSTFILSIPFIKGQSETIAPIKAHQQQNSEEPYTILVAEDEEYNYQLIEIFMSERKCTLLHALDGLEAVKICREHPEIDLILMDIKMPNLNGKAALVEIRKFNKHVPVIAQTAYALEHERQHFLDNGFDEYLPKPLRKSDLLEKIDTLLSKKTSKS